MEEGNIKRITSTYFFRAVSVRIFSDFSSNGNIAVPMYNRKERDKDFVLGYDCPNRIRDLLLTLY